MTAREGAVKEGEANLEAADSEAAAQEEILAQEKCIKQYALSADKNAKFLLSQPKANLFIAGNVSERRSSFNFLKFFFNLILCTNNIKYFILRVLFL